MLEHEIERFKIGVLQFSDRCYTYLLINISKQWKPLNALCDRFGAESNLLHLLLKN